MLYSIKKNIITYALGYTLAGFTVYFALYSLLVINQDPLVTFLASFFAGLIGLIICSIWLNNTSWGRKATIAILVAYIARIIVGVFFYLDTDPGYFQGDGGYINDDWELRWTYVNAIYVRDSVVYDDVWLPSDIVEMDEDKNAYIHSWMGYFLASGKSYNALDLTPFNAFHHAVSGFLIIAISLALGYSLYAALLAGIATAWIPWGFPASIMWRDSVGLCWVVLAITIIIIGRKSGIIINILTLPIAIFMGYSDRPVYAILVILGAIFLFIQQKYNKSKLTEALNVKFFLKLIIATLIVILVYKLFFSSTIADIHGTSDRLAMLPLLIVRGISGPFPWVDIATIFDYAFHVFQLAIFLVIFTNWKKIINRDGSLLFIGLIFWFVGIIATGVHTAYLAVAMPFLLPIAFEMKKEIGYFLVISLIFFLEFNLVFLAAGLHGKGIIGSV